MDRVVKVVDRNNKATLYEYDKNGNRKSVRYANGIISLSVIKVRSSMVKQNLDLKEALKDNIVLILLTGLFVFIAVLCIFDE